VADDPGDDRETGSRGGKATRIDVSFSDEGPQERSEDGDHPARPLPRGSIRPAGRVGKAGEHLASIRTGVLDRHDEVEIRTGVRKQVAWCCITQGIQDGAIAVSYVDVERQDVEHGEDADRQRETRRREVIGGGGLVATIDRVDERR